MLQIAPSQPTNRHIETLDFPRLSTEQMTKINEISPQVIKNF